MGAFQKTTQSRLVQQKRRIPILRGNFPSSPAASSLVSLTVHRKDTLRLPGRRCPQYAAMQCKLLSLFVRNVPTYVQTCIGTFGRARHGLRPTLSATSKRPFCRGTTERKPSHDSACAHGDNQKLVTEFFLSAASLPWALGSKTTKPM